MYTFTLLHEVYPNRISLYFRRNTNSSTKRLTNIDLYFRHTHSSAKFNEAYRPKLSVCIHSLQRISTKRIGLYFQPTHSSAKFNKAHRSTLSVSTLFNEVQQSVYTCTFDVDLVPWKLKIQTFGTRHSVFYQVHQCVL